MPSPSGRRPGASPWTVITQGRSLSYDAATLLDKLEYVVHAAPGAVARTLAQDNFAPTVSSALASTVGELSKADVLCRAGELLNAVVDWAVAGGVPTMATVTNALGAEYLGPFVALVGHHDRDVATAFATAVGKLLGSKDATAAAEEASLPKVVLTAQTTDFVTALCKLLDIVAGAPVEGEEMSEEDAISAVGSLSPSMAAESPMRTRSSVTSPDKPSSSKNDLVSQISSGMGAEYIPTVSGIVADMQTSGAGASDETLGRLLCSLASFLGKEENRDLFCSKSEGRAGPTHFTALLDREMRLPVQATYQAVFCLWLLSFPKQTSSGDGGDSVAAVALENAGTPRLLTAVVREVSAEKVVRISLATLRNMMQLSNKLRKEMIGAGLVAALQSLCMRQWNDDDINEDLQVLANSLDSELASMSTFDVYRAEILSGALEWTPPHRDDMFWRENVEKMDTNNMELLRCMVRLLNDSADTTVLCVACHDLAQFVKYHPRGRYITQSLGVKGRLMELMAQGNSEVRRYALNTVQVLMISNWNLMQRPS